MINFAKIDKNAKSPIRKHSTDAGIDIYSNEDIVLEPFSATKIHTGITFEISPYFMLLAKPKSGSNFILGAGVIDPGYQGEILIKVINYTQHPIQVNKGDALAQLVQVAIYTYELNELSIDEIHKEKSERGTDGGIVREDLR